MKLPSLIKIQNFKKSIEEYFWYQFWTYLFITEKRIDLFFKNVEKERLKHYSSIAEFNVVTW